MKLKSLATYNVKPSGEDKRLVRRGDVFTVPDDYAQDLIRRGLARRVGDSEKETVRAAPKRAEGGEVGNAKVETAAAETAPETAVKPEPTARVLRRGAAKSGGESDGEAQPSPSSRRARASRKRKPRKSKPGGKETED